jgi:ATP-dependent RNA helicase DHX8/PRP22
LNGELLLQVHPSSVLEGDEYGKFPMYVVYHELISTTRPYMRNICAVDQAWVEPILKKLEKLDINRLRYIEIKSIVSELRSSKIL